MCWFLMKDPLPHSAINPKPSGLKAHFNKAPQATEQAAGDGQIATVYGRGESISEKTSTVCLTDKG